VFLKIEEMWYNNKQKGSINWYFPNTTDLE